MIHLSGNILHTPLPSRCKYMLIYLIVTGLYFVPHFLSAQSFYRYQRPGSMNVYAAAGITKYFGELSNDQQLGKINPYLTIGLNLPLHNRWSVRPELTYYRISAADADLPTSDSRHSRNLSFRSNNFEFSGLLVYGLHAKDRRFRVSKIRPYLMAGLGVTYSNPKALLDGTWHQLQPLQTEAYPYHRIQLVVPVGAGLGLKVNDQWQVGLEISYRLSFTDYLDDVSQLYQDPFSFSNPVAADLADRRPEIGLDKAPAGNPRGNSQTNDGYLLFGLKVFYQLEGSGPLRRKL